MASLFTPNALTFTDEQVRSVQELINDAIVKGGDFKAFVTLVSGIISGKEIGHVGKMSDVGRAASGCEPTWVSPAIPITKNVWAPKGWEIPLQICAKEFLNSLAVYSQKWGTPSPDNMEGTDALTLFETKLEEAISEMFWRWIWFGDEDAANINGSPAGVITNGKDVNLINIVDGFWKQAIAIATSNPLQRVTIAANSSATYALQRSDLSPLLAWGYFEKMIEDAPLVLKGLPASEVVIYSTLGLYEKAIKYLKTAENGYLLPLESSLGQAMNGRQDLMINGYRITPMPIQDQLINDWQNDGTKWNLPHRAIMCTKDNLMVGFPGAAPVETLEYHFDQTKRTNNWFAEDQIDVKFSRNDLIMVAY